MVEETSIHGDCAIGVLHEKNILDVPVQELHSMMRKFPHCLIIAGTQQMAKDREDKLSRGFTAFGFCFLDSENNLKTYFYRREFMTGIQMFLRIGISSEAGFDMDVSQERMDAVLAQWGLVVAAIPA